MKFILLSFIGVERVPASTYPKLTSKFVLVNLKPARLHF